MIKFSLLFLLATAVSGQENTTTNTRCYQGYRAYTPDRRNVTYDTMKLDSCGPNEICGSFSYYNQTGFMLQYLESGVCIPKNETQYYNCLSVRGYSPQSKLSECKHSQCEENGCNNEVATASPISAKSQCYTGFRASSQDRQEELFNNVKNETCGVGDFCGVYRYYNQSSGKTIFQEAAFCVPASELPYWNCSSFRDVAASDPSMVTRCAFTACFGNDCNMAVVTEPEYCPVTNSTTDIQILPKCSLTEVMSRTDACFNPLAGNYPYEDNAICRSDLDAAVKCFAEVTVDCFDSTCPSILDEIDGIRDIYKMVVEYAAGVENLDQLIIRMKSGLGVDLSPLRLMCPTADQKTEILNGLDMLKMLIPEGGINMGEPLCDNNILDDFARLGLEYARKMVMATDHAQVCMIYKKTKTIIADAITHRCNLDRISDVFSLLLPGYGDLIEGGIKIALDVMDKMTIPNCEGIPAQNYTICHQGARGFNMNKSMLYFDNLTAIACEPGDMCSIYKFVNSSDPAGSYYVEAGACVPQGQSEYFTCAAAANFTNTDIKYINQCKVSFCNGSRCTEDMFTPIPLQCKETPENDLQLFPSCTLRGTLQGFTECSSTYMTNYPYKDQNQCRREIDSTLKCFANQAKECLSGGCPTILDEVVDRFYYRMIVAFADQFQSLEQVLRMLRVDKQTISFIYAAMCPEPGSKVPQEILEGLKSLQGLIPSDFQNPVCDDDVIPDLMNWAVNMIITMYEAEDQSQICMVFEAWRSNITQVWKVRCSADSLRDVLRSASVPEEYINYIIEGIDIVLDFYNSMELGDCGRTMMPDCSKFYDSTDSCAMRQAWVCDYFSWKYQVLSSWVKQYIQYNEANMISMDGLPGCPETARDLCRNSDQMKCVTPLPDCKMCFCADNMYKDLSTVVKMWRKDYMAWRKAMYHYTKNVSNDMMNCNM
ncbi:unnamed protein product [Clavelina lepadiformis]|uniref:Uncharacterized protein n=1 Tax=Clavelina lepadiformis TaxID=159417 RepID=A0ABP0FGQ9_CLALP